MPQEQDDPDIEIIKARKLKELREQAPPLEKAKKVEKQQAAAKDQQRYYNKLFVQTEGKKSSTLLSLNFRIKQG